MTTFPIYDTLETLRMYLELNVHNSRQDNSTLDWTVSLNALEKDGSNNEEKNDIVITLLRLEEETSRKSPVPVNKEKTKNGYKLTNPEIWINLYVLISSQSSVYETALQQISNVIYWMNSIPNCQYYDKNMISLEAQAIYQNISRFQVEMQSLTAEQNNSMWQTLGCKMVPAVVYKIHTVEVGALAYTKTPYGIVGIDSEGKRFDEKPVGEDQHIEWPIQITDGSLRLKLKNGIPLLENEKEQLVEWLTQLENRLNPTHNGVSVLSDEEKTFLNNKQK